MVWQKNLKDLRRRKTFRQRSPVNQWRETNTIGSQAKPAKTDLNRLLLFLMKLPATKKSMLRCGSSCFRKTGISVQQQKTLRQLLTAKTTSGPTCTQHLQKSP